MKTVILNIESNGGGSSNTVLVSNVKNLILNALKKDINAEISVHSANGFEDSLYILDLSELKKQAAGV
jgi:hypothetical protein